MNKRARRIRTIKNAMIRLGSGLGYVRLLSNASEKPVGKLMSDYRFHDGKELVGYSFWLQPPYNGNKPIMAALIDLTGKVTIVVGSLPVDASDYHKNGKRRPAKVADFDDLLATSIRLTDKIEGQRTERQVLIRDGAIEA